MKIKGDWETRRVWINGKELLPGRSQKIVNHSPDGFAWGYGGSGPASSPWPFFCGFYRSMKHSPTTNNSNGM